VSDQSLDALREGLRSVTASSKVENLSRLSGGASRETWRFEADGRPLILQRQRSGDIRDMGARMRSVMANEPRKAQLENLPLENCSLRR